MGFKADIHITCDYCHESTVTVPAGMAYHKNKHPEHVFTLEDWHGYVALQGWEIDDLEEYTSEPEAVCPKCIADGVVEVVAYIKFGMIMNPGQPPAFLWRKPHVIGRGDWFREKYFIIHDAHITFLVEARTAQDALDALFDDEAYGDVFAVPEKDRDDLDPDYTSYAGNDSRPVVDDIGIHEVHVNWKADAWALDKLGVPMGRAQAWRLKKEEWSLE